MITTMDEHDPDLEHVDDVADHGRADVEALAMTLAG